MKQSSYDRNEAARLVPLLNAIAKEILDRGAAVNTLQARLDSIPDGLRASRETLELIADRATHQRELRHASEELERLGVSVIGHDPLTFRLRARAGHGVRSFLVQCGELAAF